MTEGLQFSEKMAATLYLILGVACAGDIMRGAGPVAEGKKPVTGRLIG